MLRNSFLRAEKLLLQALRILLGLEFIEERERVPAENSMYLLIFKSLAYSKLIWEDWEMLNVGKC